ncbi:MAG TPA: tetratricopeptide repeat protein [Pyrinomonadaceae bacterium]|nr:tetratricopeptide repeat protein [Pyrinomonadaceae bacterium]
MSDFDLAEQLNNEGMLLRNGGDIAGAEAAYRAASAAAPEWSAPVYNLGLLYKYEGRWRESLVCYQHAVILAPDDGDSWWNLGIAATALGDWIEARRAWTSCGIEVPPGEGPPEFNWGHTPIRLDPNGQAEVVWARRLDPARAQIVSVPLPSSPFHWGDIVLTDGAVEGQRMVDGRTYSVFNALQLLAPSGFRTFVVELAAVQPNALAAFEDCATNHGGAAEDWGTFTSILCAECSRGFPHEHAPGTSASAHPHWGLAARDHDHANEIVSQWLANTPGADLDVWYEAPPTLPNDYCN